MSYLQFEKTDGMVERWIEKLKNGQFNFDIKHRTGKIPHIDCLSLINKEDEEKTAYVDANAMDARNWQLLESRMAKT